VFLLALGKNKIPITEYSEYDGMAVTVTNWAPGLSNVPAHNFQLSLGFFHNPLSTMTSSIKILEYDNDATNAQPCRQYYISEDGLQTSKRLFSSSSSRRSQKPSSSAKEWIHHYFVSAPSRVMCDLFLPLGYPHSVGEEYMMYQICDSVQGLCSYLRGVVSTSAVLQAAGVGNAEATAMSAAMNWAMRDGLGMVGGLTFSYWTSSLFDAHVKEFRLFADIINDVGLTLDMLAPYAGSENVLYITSVAMICKVMCGISAGATKGSITQHFCKKGNMADLNAKEGTQETLVSLIGMLLGIALAKYLHAIEKVDKSMATTLSWTVFNVLTMVHVYVNYIGVRVLHLRTLNQERTKVVLSAVISAVVGECVDESVDNGKVMKALNSLPSPKDVCESLFASTSTLLFPGSVRLGCPIGKAIGHLSASEIKALLDSEFRDERYVVTVDGKNIYSTLKLGAKEIDELKAFIHVMVIRKCQKLGTALSSLKLISHTHQKIMTLFEGDACLSLHVLDGVGWDVENRLFLGFGHWRFQDSSSCKVE
jgi:Vitamin B6 photo-protection and homoeostasis